MKSTIHIPLFLQAFVPKHPRALIQLINKNLEMKKKKLKNLPVEQVVPVNPTGQTQEPVR